MALVKCKECKSEISDSANTCPKCGAPVPKKTSTMTWVAGIVFAVIVLKIISPSSDYSSAEPVKPEMPDAKKIEEDKVWKEKFYKTLIGAKSIKASLRNPDSLIFESVFMTDNGDVCYKYRAQNGFGGLNTEYAVLTKKGNFYHNNYDLQKKKCYNVNGQEVKESVKMAPL